MIHKTELNTHHSFIHQTVYTLYMLNTRNILVGKKITGFSPHKVCGLVRKIYLINNYTNKCIMKNRDKGFE